MNVSMRRLLTCCCGNRGHGPHLNRIVGVQLGSSRRAGPAPRVHPGPPNALSPDPALAQNLGMLLHFQFFLPVLCHITKKLNAEICHLLTSSLLSVVPFDSLALILYPVFCRSRSRRHSNRRYSRSRSRSYSHRRKSRSRSYSPEYRRRRSQSTSPMSNRRRHTGSRVSLMRSRKEQGRAHVHLA